MSVEVDLCQAAIVYREQQPRVKPEQILLPDNHDLVVEMIAKMAKVKPHTVQDRAWAPHPRAGSERLCW